ncbi:MAG: hypothetical protein V1787_00255 [Candidatus Micrarchaeota archaeon]
MGVIDDISKSVFKYLTESVRRFTAFVFIVYAIGVLVGIRAAGFDVEIQRLTWMIPLLLALLSYMYTQIAVVFFLIFVLAIFLLGI